MNAIECKSVCKRYGDFAIDGLDLNLPEGCVLGLVGENGAGKSTLMRMMMGACRADAGEIAVLGKRMTAGSEGCAIKEDIGVVLDESCLPKEMTAAQTGRMMEGIYKNWDGAKFAQLVKAFGLPDKTKLGQYSRGMKMKLAIACALSHNARLLMLDEATSGLDPIVRDEILDILNDFTREETHSVLISSHIVSDLEKICDYIAFMHKGRITLFEEKDALAEKYGVAAVSDARFGAMDKTGVLYAMRAHGAVRLLVLRDLYAGEAQGAGIEDIMLLMTKGEKCA